MTFDGSFPLEGGYVAGNELRDGAIAVGPPARDALLRVLEAGHPQMRRGALEALFAIFPEEGETRAVAMLWSDRDIEAREAAAWALAQCTSVASGEALIAAQKDRSAEVALAASRALARRFDPLCTDHIEAAARSGTLTEMVIDALVITNRLGPVRLSADGPWRNDAWSSAVRSLLASEDGYDAKRVLGEPELSTQVARSAANAVLQRSPPAEAFAILSPWATSRGKRADAIMWELDQRLTEYSTGEVKELLDPRWETHCVALAHENDEAMIRDNAKAIAAGLAYYRAPRPPHTPAFSELSLPDCEEDSLPAPYPLLVVAFEPSREWAAPNAGDWMPTLYDIRHQVAGTSTRQIALVGFVLPIPPDLVARLGPLVHASSTGDGTKLTPSDLAEYASALREHWPGAPSMAWGYEAIVMSEPAVSLEMFYGTPVLYFEPQRRPWEGPIFMFWPWPKAVERGTFSRIHVDELRAAAALAGRSALRVAVLWANSD